MHCIMNSSQRTQSSFLVTVPSVSNSKLWDVPSIVSQRVLGTIEKISFILFTKE